MILYVSCWFLVVLCGLKLCLAVLTIIGSFVQFLGFLLLLIFGYFWLLFNYIGGSWYLMVVLCGSWWFLVVLVVFCCSFWFLVVLGGFMVVLCDFW